MGLFTSKKTYIAHAASSSLYDASPNTLKKQIVAEAVGGTQDSTMAGAVMYTINTDLHARAKAMSRYARKKYVRGFPTSNIIISLLEAEDVEDALSRAVGEGNWDYVRSSTISDRNERFLLMMFIKDYWANPEWFPWPQGVPELWDEGDETIPIPVVDPTTGEYYQIENFPQYVRNDPNYQVYFEYTDSAGVEQVWDLAREINLDSGYPADSTYLHVKYELNGGKIFYWIYEFDTGLDPILESKLDREEKYGEYMPVAIMMQDKVWFNEDPDSDLAKTTNGLLRKMAVKGDDVRDDFEEQEQKDLDSGDYDEMDIEKWDFFIHWAVPIHTNVPESKQYLYHFFDQLSEWQQHTAADYNKYVVTWNGKTGPKKSEYDLPQPVSELNISEGDSQGFDVSYRFSYIERHSKAGYAQVPFGNMYRDMKDDEVEVEIFSLFRTEDEGYNSPTATAARAKYQAAIDKFWGGHMAIGVYSSEPEKGGYHDFVLITRQTVHNGIANYTQTLVMGLSMQYKINTSDFEKKRKGFRYRYADIQLGGLDTETNEFRMPIHLTTLRKLKMLKREHVIADAATATVFLVEITSVAWYRSGFFKWLIVLIALILIALSIFFPGFLMAAAVFLAAAFGGAALAIFIIWVILAFAVAFMISLASSMPGVAGKIVRIAAIMAAVYSLATGGFANLTGAFSNAGGGFGGAVAFINAAAPIYNVGFAVYSNKVMGDLEADMRDFTLDAREKEQQLQDAYDTIGEPPDWLDPMDLIAIFVRQGGAEKADDYLVRCLDPNPGQASIELIGDFYEAALVLPEEPGGRTIIDGEFVQMSKQRGA